jgi:hypothetical protein
MQCLSFRPSVYSIQCRVQVDSSRVCCVCVGTLMGRGETKKASTMNQAFRPLHNDVGSYPPGLSFAMSTVFHLWPTADTWLADSGSSLPDATSWYDGPPRCGEAGSMSNTPRAWPAFGDENTLRCACFV